VATLCSCPSNSNLTAAAMTIAPKRWAGWTSSSKRSLTRRPCWRRCSHERCQIPLQRLPPCHGSAAREDRGTAGPKNGQPKPQRWRRGYTVGDPSKYPSNGGSIRKQNGQRCVKRSSPNSMSLLAPSTSGDWAPCCAFYERRKYTANHPARQRANVRRSAPFKSNGERRSDASKAPERASKPNLTPASASEWPFNCRN
jgi:hypothetical protein